MASHKTQPPWEFLLSASKNSLQSYEFSRLGHAANLRKEIGALLDQWMNENASAMLARWLMDNRERPAQAPDTGNATDLKSNGVQSASDNFLTDQQASRVNLGKSL